MRMLGSAMTCLLFGGSVCAQPAAPKPEPADRIDAVLLKVEQRMKDIESVRIPTCVRTDRDRGGEKHWEGEVRFLKPNLFALRLVQREDPKFFELMISTGKYLHEYRPQFKKVVITELPASRPGVTDNNMLSLMFCQSAADAKRRYDFKITKEMTKDGVKFVFIEIAPKSAADKREFSRAELVLAEATALPRRLWFEHPNGSSVQWDFVQMDAAARLTLKDFAPPPAPAGWETQRQSLDLGPAPPDDGKPRVIRSGADK